MEQKVIVLIGLPGSGKSTWAKELVKTKSKWKRINKDDLRGMLDGGVWSKVNELFIKASRNALIELALDTGYSVIVDDTNIHPKNIQEIESVVQDWKDTFVTRPSPSIPVEIKVFYTSVSQCIANDLTRSGRAQVGEQVIRKMYEQLKQWQPSIANKIQEH